MMTSRLILVLALTALVGVTAVMSLDNIDGYLRCYVGTSEFYGRIFVDCGGNVTKCHQSKVVGTAQDDYEGKIR